MRKEFYDERRSYEQNYDDGPFGLFCKKPKELPQTQRVDFLGFPVDVPFGIPAGPLLNSRFIQAAWNWGFSIATYKTVRGDAVPCHPFPNVIAVRSTSHDIHPGETVRGNLAHHSIDVTRDGITNSFGVPSKPAGVWQADVRKALRSMKKGNVLVLSFMGTKKEGEDRDRYIENFVSTCKLALDTGSPILEVNFSCPNFGKEGLICNDLKTSADILEALKRAKGNTPLLVKIGYFAASDEDHLEKLLEAIHSYANGVVAINTVQAKVVDAAGNQVLPGSPVRLMSGICGAAIRWAGLEMADRIVSIKRKKGWKNFVVVGVGGVITPEDYIAYMKCGVDAVQSATGAMWNPKLAVEVRNI